MNHFLISGFLLFLFLVCGGTVYSDFNAQKNEKLQMYTPLHAAASSGQITVVKFLLEYQVEVDAVNVHGNTALHIACLNGQDPVVTELLQFGASINSVNHRGMVSNHSLYNTFICKLVVKQEFPFNINYVNQRHK